MDVVKTNLEKIKGVIDIETKEGQGTCLTITIPLTTSITDGMVFTIGKDFYILPMESLVHIVDLKPTQLTKMHNGQEIIHVRDQVYSFFRLEDIFRTNENLPASDQSENMRVILFNTTKQVVAVRIDEVLGKTMAILRPLGSGLEDAHGISGASLLGNGHLALVLDPLGLEHIFNAGPESSPKLEHAV